MKFPSSSSAQDYHCLLSFSFLSSSFALNFPFATMDAYNNPFFGWPQAGQGGSTLRDANNGFAPSTFGALPFGQPLPTADLITFQISSFSPDILNSTVVGPNQQTYMRIVTDPQNPTYTLFQRSQGRSCALVEWQRHPLVEIRDVMSKRPARDWLHLNADERYRVFPRVKLLYTCN